MKKLLKSLSETEYLLVRETKRENLMTLDEEELLALHRLVRRARNKHVKLYRREAALAVGDKGARGSAQKTTGRNAARAEIFEDALARVSRRLGILAKQSADELKSARLELARKDSPVSSDGAAASGPSGSQKGKSKSISGGEKRQAAASASAGAANQAKRDA